MNPDGENEKMIEGRAWVGDNTPASVPIHRSVWEVQSRHSRLFKATSKKTWIWVVGRWADLGRVTVKSVGEYDQNTLYLILKEFLKMYKKIFNSILYILPLVK